MPSAGSAGGAGPAGSVMCTGQGSGAPSMEQQPSGRPGNATSSSAPSSLRNRARPGAAARAGRNRACRVSAPDEHRPRDAVVRTRPLSRSMMSAGTTMHSSSVRTTGATHPRTRRGSTTRSPTHRCPNDPENVQMNSTCRTAKMASWIQVCVMSPDPATGDQTPVTNATRSASTPSMSSATMRRPMRPTLRGPSPETEVLPGHPSGARHRVRGGGGGRSGAGSHASSVGDPRT